jgi:thiamine pyrophosphate-dependent acetolactate synthase large subunit-like protein
MAAMSMADGYARVTGKAQCVIVHVDVGTQALGAAVHNASSGRCPVLIFAGLSPFTQEGELRGSRSEFIHWLQDVPDQRAIVAQYCRYTNEIRSGVNVKQMVNRALQFATSSPQGPVYLCATREVLEADMEPYQMSLPQRYWEPVRLGGLPPKGAMDIAEALAGASRPLVVTGYSGRNLDIPKALVELADTVKALRVLDTAGSDMCFPGDHPAWLGVRQGADASIPEADVILVLDCDVPWIPTLCKPRPDATVFHIDADPLKQRMPLFYIQADARYQADSLLSVEQILGVMRAPNSEAATILNNTSLSNNLAAAEATRRESYSAKIERIDHAAGPLSDGKFGVAHLSKQLRAACPDDTIWVVEAVSNTGFIHDNVRPTQPGSWINCGAGGLGWSGGAALGIKLAADAEGRGQFVCHVVGDGTFLFSGPSSVYWIAHRYNIPVLTIVLNNKGKFESRTTIPHAITLAYLVSLIRQGRLERAAQVVHAGASERRGLQGDRRRHAYLVCACARLRRHCSSGRRGRRARPPGRRGEPARDGAQGGRGQGPGWEHDGCGLQNCARVLKEPVLRLVLMTLASLQWPKNLPMVKALNSLPFQPQFILLSTDVDDARLLSAFSGTWLRRIWVVHRMRSWHHHLQYLLMSMLKTLLG